jgi:hypothetical protein
VNNRLPQPSWRKKAERANGLLSKIVCVFDDIPFLLRQYVGNVGPFLLFAAGLIIFPIQIFEGFLGLHEAWMKHDKYSRVRKPDDRMSPKLKSLIVNSTTRIGLSIVGIAVTAALLTFVLTHLAVLEGAASIAIPAIMTVISGVDLVSDLFAWRRAKNAYLANSTPRNYEKLIDAKRDTIFSGISLGFGMAITGLATLGVLSGLGVVSLGVVPSAVLIGVVVVALAVKIFEMIDEKYEYRFTNKIRSFFKPLFGGERVLHQVEKNTDLRWNSTANIIKSTGGKKTASLVASGSEDERKPLVSEENNYHAGNDERFDAGVEADARRRFG